MANMRDVAREAGVSTGAVSRILRNMPGFKPETVRRVWATAEALGYGRTPGIAGDSGGASNKPLKIGVFHAYPQDMDKNRPYYQAIRNGIELESAAHNIELVQVFWTDHPKPLATNGELHGAIYLGSASWPWISGAAAIEEFSSSLITQAMVFIGASPDPLRYASIESDLEGATGAALHHLLELGHTRIGYIGCSDSPHDGRLTTFRRTLRAVNNYDKNLEYVTRDFLPAEGKAVIHQIAEQQAWPTAFFVGADSLALGVLSALHELSIRIPDEISLISFGNADYAPYLIPPLTSVNAFTDQIGRMAIRLLADDSWGALEVPLKIIFPTRMIVRESTAPPRTSEFTKFTVFDQNKNDNETS